MNPSIPPMPSDEGSPRPAVPKRRRWLMWGCLSLLGLMLVIVATVAFTIWYIQRPIKPVELSAKEKAVVEQKLEHLDAASRNSNTKLPRQANVPTAPVERDRPYTPGSKQLRLEERELNGLLNANTDLGKTLRFELGRNAINAYVAVPIPNDFPVMPGKMFRARGRFSILITNGAPPYAVLEDVTVFGVSLPKAWLGGLKGENLLSEAVGTQHGTPLLQGVKSLHIEPGVLILELED